MQSRWTAAIVLLLSLFVIVIFVGQTFMSGGEKVVTETVLTYSAAVDTAFEGVYLRDESLIYSGGSGVISYEHEDGSKVGNSSIIAYRYKNESDISYRREIERLNAHISVLQDAQRLVGTNDNSQLEYIGSQLDEAHSAFMTNLIEGNYDGAEAYENTILDVLCRREIAKGTSSGYDAKIAQLNSRIAQLEAMLSGDVQAVTANGTGYFVSRVDGYESQLSFNSGETLTAQQIENIIKNPDISVGTNAVGKLISGYHWRVAALIDREELFGIYAGSTVTLRVGSSASTLEGEVISITDSGRGDGTAIYIFECDRLTSDVVSGRTSQFKLVLDNYGGLRVPRSAIRYKSAETETVQAGESQESDELRGVYVVRGSSLVFKKINVVYWGSDYVICSQEADDDYLKLYDEIVTIGKDLYDGKIVE